MVNQTIVEAIESISSNSPVPGGGAVSALSAALSASLLEMAANLTIGKKFYNEYPEELKNKIINIRETAGLAKKEFLELMEKDNQAFSLVMDAFKMPKETDEEKKIRSNKIQEGYIAAMNVPLEVSRKIFKLFEHIEEMVCSGNPNCVTDTGVAAIQAYAAMEGAVLNVKINLTGIKDEKIKDDTKLECKNLLAEARRKKDAIMQLVNEKLKK